MYPIYLFPHKGILKYAQLENSSAVSLRAGKLYEYSYNILLPASYSCAPLRSGFLISRKANAPVEKTLHELPTVNSEDKTRRKYPFPREAPHARITLNSLYLLEMA